MLIIAVGLLLTEPTALSVLAPVTLQLSISAPPADLADISIFALLGLSAHNFNFSEENYCSRCSSLRAECRKIWLQLRS